MKNLPDLGHGAADSAENAFEVEVALLKTDIDPKQWFNEALHLVKELRDDHPQKDILICYIKAGLRAVNANNVEATKFHILLVTKHWPQIDGEKVQAEIYRARSEGGKSTAEQKREQQQANIEDTIERWEKLAKYGYTERERAGIIALQKGRPVDTVRRWINKAGLR